MAYTYEELSGKTLAELREIAKGLDDETVRGYSQLHKERLLPALCKVFGIDTYVHHHVVGIDKTAIKAQIRQLKQARDGALKAHDHAQLKDVRRKIHHLKRKIRAATV